MPAPKVGPRFRQNLSKHTEWSLRYLQAPHLALYSVNSISQTAWKVLNARHGPRSKVDSDTKVARMSAPMDDSVKD